MSRRVRISFPSLFAFRRELEDNIACGGVFVQTDEDFALRELIDVEVDLPFCDQSVVLNAEVVSRIHRSVGRGGIAVQFSDGASEIRQLLSGMVGVDTPLELSRRRDQPDGPVRYHPRSSVRIPAVVETGDAKYAGRTVNLSLSGALLELEGKLLEIGTDVVLSLPHPESRKAIQFPARVVRHAETSDLQRPRMGVQFELEASAESPKNRLLDLLLKAAHSRRLGRVTGDVRAMSVANLLQMLSSSSERGTLVLQRGCTKARALFEEGALRYVAVDGATGMKALVRLLAWKEGSFEFTPTIGVDAPGGRAQPLDRALLQASRHLDELERMDLSDFPAHATVYRAPAPDPDDADRVSASVLAVIADGVRVAELLDALSGCDDAIYRALICLRDAGAIKIAREI